MTFSVKEILFLVALSLVCGISIGGAILEGVNREKIKGYETYIKVTGNPKNLTCDEWKESKKQGILERGGEK